MGTRPRWGLASLVFTGFGALACQGDPGSSEAGATETESTSESAESTSESAESTSESAESTSESSESTSESSESTSESSESTSESSESTSESAESTSESTESTEGESDETGEGPCLSDARCPGAALCIDGACLVEAPLGPCAQAPTLVERALPGGLPAGIVALAFAELDGDPGDELVLLHGGGLTVVDGAVRVDTGLPEPMVYDDFAALDLDGGAGGLDLALTSTAAATVAQVFGTGAGDFAGFVEQAVPGALAAPTPVDGDLDGDLELAVVFVPDTLEILLLGGDGLGLATEHLLQVPNAHEDIVRADADGDGDLDLLVVDGSTAHKVRANPGGEWSSGGQVWGLAPGWELARWVVGDLDQDGIDQAVSVVASKGQSVLQTWSGDFYAPDQLEYAVVSGAFQAAAFAGDSLVLANAGALARVAASDGVTLGCSDVLEGAPGAVALAAGTVETSPSLALLDSEGAVRVFDLVSP